MESKIVAKVQLESAIGLCLKHEAKTGNEFAVVFNREGHIVETFAGNEDCVTPSKQAMQKAVGGVLVHNHPGSGSFSAADLVTTTRFGMKEIWAVGADGSKYRSEGMVEKMANHPMVNQVVEGIHIVASQILGRLWDKQEITTEQATQVSSHLCNLVYLKKGMVKIYEYELGTSVLEAYHKVMKSIDGKEKELFVGVWK